MNNEEMRKMWEEAANRNKRMEAADQQPTNTPHNKTSEPDNKPRGHPPRGTDEAARRQAAIKTQSDLFAIRKSFRSLAPMPKSLYPSIYGGAVNKFIPKTEETP